MHKSQNTFLHKPGEGGIISASRQMREWRFREAESAAQGTRLRQLRTHPDHRREGQVKNWAGHGGWGGGTGGYSQVCRKDTREKRKVKYGLYSPKAAAGEAGSGDFTAEHQGRREREAGRGWCRGIGMVGGDERWAQWWLPLVEGEIFLVLGKRNLKKLSIPELNFCFRDYSILFI